VAAYHVVWECVVEQWLGVRRMTCNILMTLFLTTGLLKKKIARFGFRLQDEARDFIG